jgi:hypothetical protein
MAQKLMTIEESRALDEKDETLWWYYWEVMAGRMPPTAAAYVPVGFYRYKQRDGRSFPLAIWRGNDGLKRTQLGDFKTKVLSTPEIEGAFAYDTFASCASSPIPHSTYLFWKEHKSWPIETAGEAAVDASLQKPEPKPEPKAEAPVRGIGDNSIGPATDYATFLDQVAAALAGLEGAAAVDSDEKAGAAQSLRSRLNELAGEGDKLRAAEKQPHLDASRAVDEKWFPKIREAQAGAAALKKGIESHANAKMRADRERQAREAAEAEKVRLAAAEANKVVVSSGPEPTQAAPPAEAPKPAAAPAAEPVRIKGNYGRATSAKMRKEIETIDYRMVCDQFVDTNDELKAVLRKIAQRAVDIGAPVPGVTIIEVAKIR